MRALGVLEPDVEPRATEHIPQMIEMIETLIAPRYLEMDMTKGLSTQQRYRIARRTPMRRLESPNNVVGPASSFLATKRSSLALGFLPLTWRSLHVRRSG